MDNQGDAHGLLLNISLKLCGSRSLPEVTAIIREACSTLLSDCERVVVYVKELTSQNLICLHDNNSTLPPHGIAHNGYKSRRQQFHSNVDPTDPAYTQLCLHQLKFKRALVSPICLPESGQVFMIVLAHCSTFTRTEQQSLDIIQKQVTACYQRISLYPASAAAAAQNQDLLRLCADLNDRDATSLQIKLVQYICRQTEADSGFLMLVESETWELNIQVIRDIILSEEIRLSTDSGVFSLFHKRDNPARLADLPPECVSDLEKILNIKLSTFLAVPVISKSNNEIIAFMCVVNKNGSSSFKEDDVSSIETCFTYTATVLASSLAVINERRLKNETQCLLQVARNLFTHLDDLTTLLREIMQEARNLTQAERCSVFLIDEETDELVAKVFDGVTTEKEPSEQTEIRMPITQGIAGKVATSGDLLNIKDAYSHPLFYRGIDQNTGFRTRNILCFPIKDENGKVIGVAQLCNKKTSHHFTHFDEEIASAFSVYCCISIIHTLMYKRLQDIHNRNSIATELMLYHMKVPHEDVNALSSQECPPTLHYHRDFTQFHYSPRTLDDNLTALAIISMFEELGFMSRWRIRRETLAAFVLMARKGYRDPPYHNWMHAFSVAHFSFLLITNLRLKKYLDDIELFALFVSCICHDIDHRGTNNSFQLASQSVLAQLYSSEGSVMERHHLAQSMCILNTEGCNIFENLSHKDYQRVLDLVKDDILATDIAHHLRILKSVECMAEEGYNVSNTKHHKLLQCILMTASDLSDQTKDWTNTKEVAALIYQEFFSQGDLEKELGRSPVEMMDRDRARIPDLQISFLDYIAQPTYHVLSKLFPETEQTLLKTVVENKTHWKNIKLKLEQGDSDRRMTLNEMLAIDVDM